VVSYTQSKSRTNSVMPWCQSFFKLYHKQAKNNFQHQNPFKQTLNHKH